MNFLAIFLAIFAIFSMVSADGVAVQKPEGGKGGFRGGHHKRHFQKNGGVKNKFHH